jgi:hypothetical protein
MPALRSADSKRPVRWRSPASARRESLAGPRAIRWPAAGRRPPLPRAARSLCQWAFRQARIRSRQAPAAWLAPSVDPRSRSLRPHRAAAVLRRKGGAGLAPRPLRPTPVAVLWPAVSLPASSMAIEPARARCAHRAPRRVAPARGNRSPEARAHGRPGSGSTAARASAGTTAAQPQAAIARRAGAGPTGRCRELSKPSRLRRHRAAAASDPGRDGPWPGVAACLASTVWLVGPGEPHPVIVLSAPAAWERRFSRLREVPRAAGDEVDAFRRCPSVPALRQLRGDKPSASDRR